MSESGWIKSSFSGAATDNCVEVRWRKASFSGGVDDNCVEVGWVKSSFSGAMDDNCVEVRLHPTTVGIRDSKNPDATLAVPPATWLAFIAATTGS